MKAKECSIDSDSELLQSRNDSSEDWARKKIHFLDVLRLFWRGKLIIIISTIVFTSAFVVYAKSLPNIYKATSKLIPLSESGGSSLGGLAGQFGGLASLAGINLGSSVESKTILALELIKSRSFIEPFIQKHNLLVPLMASKGWDSSSNELIINKKLYDVSTQTWLREPNPPFGSKPSSWEGFKKLSDIISIAHEKDTGVITISLEHESPTLAKLWLTLIINEINDTVRADDKKDAEQSIVFLEEKLTETVLTDMRNVFYQLIQEQTKTMMLAEANRDYVFKVIDLPNVPDVKAKPNRMLIVFLGGMLGASIGTLMFFTYHFRFLWKHNNSEH